MSDNLFMRASREGWRFATNRGDLTVEQLWQLPLTRKDGFDLDNVARNVNAEIKDLSDTSFVSTAPSPKLKEFEAKLELVKAIIAVKIDEQNIAKKRAERAAERSKLIDALAAAEARELSSASKEDLLAKLAAVDGD